MTFDDFYKPYPRKKSGKYAKACFERLSDDDKRKAIEALPNHMALWKAEGRELTFIPYPASFLNGAMWEDEIEMPEVKQPDWWRSEMGIARRAKELSMNARPGEAMSDFIGRLRAA